LIGLVNTLGYGNNLQPEIQRLSRKEWLKLALEEVAKEGGAKLRIDKLVEGLGVTKGSFY
jgi:hypothetical protein